MTQSWRSEGSETVNADGLRSAPSLGSQRLKRVRKAGTKEKTNRIKTQLGHQHACPNTSHSTPLCLKISYNKQTAAATTEPSPGAALSRLDAEGIWHSARKLSFQKRPVHWLSPEVTQLSHLRDQGLKGKRQKGSSLRRARAICRHARICRDREMFSETMWI